MHSGCYPSCMLLVPLGVIRWLCPLLAPVTLWNDVTSLCVLVIQRCCLSGAFGLA